uniref:Protein broad-minded n=1 Tax=Parascaris univalens TaxID=6257 RepID=A0A915B1E7_PARUN
SFAGSSTFGLDLAQSTRFPGDSDTTRLVEQLEDPEASTQQRVALLNSLLSLSTSAIGKKKQLTQILRICKQTIMEENTLSSTLMLLKKLFNTKDSDIVSEVLCSLISNMSSVLHSSLHEGSKLKAVMLLFKMICVTPALWPRFQPQSIFKMISSLIQYIGSVDINDMSISNLVAILAALDPRANWMRSWVHALSSRQIMRASLPSFACKAKNFICDRPEWGSSKYQSAFLHYSPKELLILMHTNLCSVLFIWMKYDDLYAIFGNDEWTQILESVVSCEFDRNNKSSSNKTIAKLLYEVAYCRTPAEFLLSTSAVRILSKIRSVCGIRIIRIALTVSPPSDLSVPLICAEICGHISNHSRAKRYEALLCLCLLVSRIGWANVGSYIHCDFIEYNGDEEINRVVREIRAMRKIYLNESLADYLKCESACNFAIPSHFLEVTSADQKLVVSKIMDLCMREDDADESLVSTAHLRLSAQVVALIWQPRTGVDLLKCFDCSLLLQDVINKSYESGDSSALVMLRVFTLNLDVAVELRSQAKMLRRLFQALSTSNVSDVGQN